MLLFACFCGSAKAALQCERTFFMFFIVVVALLCSVLRFFSLCVHSDVFFWVFVAFEWGLDSTLGVSQRDCSKWNGYEFVELLFLLTESGKQLFNISMCYPITTLTGSDVIAKASLTQLLPGAKDQRVLVLPMLPTFFFVCGFEWPNKCCHSACLCLLDTLAWAHGEC